MKTSETDLPANLAQIKTEVFDNLRFAFSEFKVEAESTAYAACRFTLNGQKIISRDAKLTPKKVGQFVTFWKRAKNGPIEPFQETDEFDFYVVNVRTKSNFGQFVFPKAVLVRQGIVSTDKKTGKLAFRVYPAWDIAKNKQAERTQRWQLGYFYEISENTDLQKVLSILHDKA